MTLDPSQEVMPLPLLTFAPFSAYEPLILKDVTYNTDVFEIDSPGILEYTTDAIQAHIHVTEDLSPPKEIAEKIIALHFGRQIPGVTLSMTDIHDLYCFFSRRFQIFALRLESFRHLSPNDRSVLFSLNTPLYFQYHLSHYVNADCGLEQITGLLNVDPSFFFQNELIPTTSCDSANFILNVSFHYFASVCGLFYDKAQVYFYEAFADSLRELQISSDTVHHIAEVLLFYCSPHSRLALDDPVHVERQYEKALSSLRREMHAFHQSKKHTQSIKNNRKLKKIKSEANLEPLHHTITQYNSYVETLQRMSQFYSQHISICSFGEETPTVSATLELPDEHLFWDISEVIQRDFDRPFREFNLGISHESKLNEDFIFQILHERLHFVLKACPGFYELSEQDQRAIWKRNGLLALGILCLYLEGESDPRQRLNILLGKEELYHFRSRDLCDQTLKLAIFTDTSTSDKLMNLVPHNQDITKLVILCVLFEGHKSLADWCVHYKYILADRLRIMKNCLRNAPAKDIVFQLIADSSDTRRTILQLATEHWSKFDNV